MSKIVTFYESTKLTNFEKKNLHLINMKNRLFIAYDQQLYF